MRECTSAQVGNIARAHLTLVWSTKDLSQLTSQWRGSITDAGTAQHTLPLPRKDLICVSSFPTVDRWPAPCAVPSSEWTQHQPG